MITISLCMIVKNEEETLEKCLDSVKDIVDEIVIVDTGSTDRTKEIASVFTENIYDFAWVDDFAAARNFSFEQAQMDYILWLDADDIILPGDADKLRELKKTLADDIDIVMMKYNTGFDQWGNVTFSYYRERLAKRNKNFRWTEPVHEYLSFGGRIIDVDICVTHTKVHNTARDRNIQVYEKLIASGHTLSPRGTYYYARELKDNGRFSEAAQLFSKFLDSGLGWQEDNITACRELAACYTAENMHKETLFSLYRSFCYDTPRAETCCMLGYYYKERCDYRQAAFWFRLALTLEKPTDGWGFIQGDSWGFVPSIECAVCYDYLKEYEKASSFNDIAAIYKPNSPAVLYNKEYFAKRLKLS